MDVDNNSSNDEAKEKIEEDGDGEDESTHIKSDFFSKNIYSALDIQTTPDATTTTSDAAEDVASTAHLTNDEKLEYLRLAIANLNK